MTNFYVHVEQEIRNFIENCRDLTNPISCLTTNSFETFSSTSEHLDVFIEYLSNDTSDMSMEYNRIISIVSNCTDLMNFINTYQNIFIEYAINDYLLLDEHIHTIYEKVLRIIDELHHLSNINTDIYQFEKNLLSYLPLNYSHRILSTFSKSIALTLIEETARLFSSTLNTLDNDDDNDDCIINSSFLFSSCTLLINSNKNEIIHQNNNNNEQSISLLQLDKINLRTPMLIHSQLTTSFQFDLTDLEQIADDLKEKTNWIEIEREFVSNIISIWSIRDRHIQTINPSSSENLWKFLMNFNYSNVNFQCEFILIIQWAFCLLTIQALNRDWDLFFTRALVNTIMINRWRLINSSSNIHISLVGYYLNQIFVRLIRLISVLQYMKILVDQSNYLISFFSNIISMEIKNLSQRIQGIYQLLFIWIKQNADTFINGNALEHALIICQSDHRQLSISIHTLISTLQQVNNCEELIQLIKKYNLSIEMIIEETMNKLYQRIQNNATQHFNDTLPITSTDWRIVHQQNPFMIIACDKLLKSIFNQMECLNIEKKFEIYENILMSFVQAWLTILRQRKYRFNNEMINLLQKDFEYIQTFLSMNISDRNIFDRLNRSSALQQLFNITKTLKDGDQIGSDIAYSQLSDNDKWLDHRRSTSSIYNFIQYACCCHRRNRVTTDPT